jgi:hypothetical protein
MISSSSTILHAVRHGACLGAGGALLAATLAVAPAAHAGSLNVRDPAGGQWLVVENPDDDHEDYLLKHLGGDRKPDPRFGRGGMTNFTMGSDNDSPSSVRVEASSGRVWMVGSNLAGSRPQPVVARFDPNGNVDLRWGVQGKVQLSPSGMGVRPNDVLPLSDGSVLVAGETPNLGSPRAIVYHLKADGSLDLSFGSGGVWQRPGGEGASATSLAVGGDGTVAVSVTVRSQRPSGEIWSLNDKPPLIVAKDPLDEGVDEEDTRIEWIGDRWTWNTNGGPTNPVPAASLQHKASLIQTSPASAASSDPGQGAFNPFAATSTASAPPPPQVEEDNIPWLWIALAAALAMGMTTVFFMGRREPQPPARPNARR